MDFNFNYISVNPTGGGGVLRSAACCGALFALSEFTGLPT